MHGASFYSKDVYKTGSSTYGIPTANKDPLPVAATKDPSTQASINVEDFNTHGTHIAGTIAAEMDNVQGIVGVNPNAKIMAIKVGYQYASNA
jgi:subtilisin family serine protease